VALDLAAVRATLDFLLHDWLEVEQLGARERFAEHGSETYAAVLDLCQRIAADKFEPFNRRVDVEEPTFDGEQVRLPDCTEQACAAYAASGMLAASLDYADGGMQLPCVVEMAANSFFSAASIGLKAYSLLTIGNANLLMAHGSALQRQVFAAPQFEGRFFGTMNLSEPQAGSSISDIATRALPDGPDHTQDPLGPRYRLSGRKMWISGGDHAMGQNIVHLVLAKIPQDDGSLPAGTGGISLFVVPKYLLDAQGALTGERNDIALAGLNHKLGYRGTTNALLNYGEGTFPVRAPGGLDGKGSGAIGYRIGEPGAGLKCMFHMMNEARIQVGLGAAMLGYAGYLASLDYARERPQGRPVAPGRSVAKNAQQPQVAIIEHADVKRMLLAQKAYCEGALALQLYCARLVDELHTGEADEAERARPSLEVLTPIAKSWPSEWCLEANSLAIQVLGGYGYTRDFPVEQHWRDNRLNMIHEGTHGIQGLDLLGRKALMNEGAALEIVFERMRTSARAASAVASLTTMSVALAEAVDTLAHATRQAWSTGNAQETLANATCYLRAFGHIVMAWIWLELALTSCRALDQGSAAADFHAGKLAAARYFFTFELPLAAVWLEPVAQREALLRTTQPQWF
jgi:butyryl-CoA dehydrogenase